MVKKVEDLKINCSKCQKIISVKYNYPKKKYSDKNHWHFWTEKKEDKDKYFCDKCISDLYYKRKLEYLEAVKNEKKRILMRNYVKKIFNS